MPQGITDPSQILVAEHVPVGTPHPQPEPSESGRHVVYEVVQRGVSATAGNLHGKAWDAPVPVGLIHPRHPPPVEVELSSTSRTRHGFQARTVYKGWRIAFIHFDVPERIGAQLLGEHHSAAACHLIRLPVRIGGNEVEDGFAQRALASIRGFLKTLPGLREGRGTLRERHPGSHNMPATACARG